MKKITSLFIGCSLALVAAVMAQQPEDQQSPAPKANKSGGEKKPAQTAEVQTGANGAGTEKKANRAVKHERRAQAQGQGQDQGQPQTQGQGQGQGQNAAAAGEQRGGGGKHHKAGKNQNAEATSKTENAGATGATGAAATTPTDASAGASVAPEGRKHAGRQNRQNAKAEKAKANAAASAAPNANAGAGASTSAATATTQQNAQAGANANAGVGRSGKMKRADQTKLQQIRTQHASFRAQPRPDKVPTVTFNLNYRIEGSDHWQGQQYEVFRSYHPERHDRNWYHSRYRRVELVGGGYYYWNNGYWYPAWGYDSSAEYYVYDGPIYVGHRVEPPDQVIADVQAELQELGYYQGEVDGLVGPLTRQALRDYQADQGLVATAVIDEPTLDSLGMSS